MQPGGPIVLGELVSGVEIILLDDEIEHTLVFNRARFAFAGPVLRWAISTMSSARKRSCSFVTVSATIELATWRVATLMTA